MKCFVVALLIVLILWTVRSNEGVVTIRKVSDTVIKVDDDKAAVELVTNQKKSSAAPGKRSCVQLHIESTQEVSQSSVGLW